MKKRRASRCSGPFEAKIPLSDSSPDKPAAAALARLKVELRALRGQVRGEFDIKGLVRESRRSR